MQPAGIVRPGFKSNVGGPHLPPSGCAGEVELLRNEVHRHFDNDREDFNDVRRRLDKVDEVMTLKFQSVKDEINGLSGQLMQWSGALGLAKWARGLGIPAILGAIVTHVVRHW